MSVERDMGTLHSRGVQIAQIEYAIHDDNPRSQGVEAYGTFRVIGRALGVFDARFPEIHLADGRKLPIIIAQQLPRSDAEEAYRFESGGTYDAPA